MCKPWCWHIYIFTLILRVPVGNSVRGAVELGFLRFDMWNSADPWQSHNAKSNLGTNKNKTTRPTSWKNTQIYSSTGPIYHDLPILFFFTRLVYIYMCVCVLTSLVVLLLLLLLLLVPWQFGFRRLSSMACEAVFSLKGGTSRNKAAKMTMTWTCCSIVQLNCCINNSWCALTTTHAG